MTPALRGRGRFLAALACGLAFGAAACVISEAAWTGLPRPQSLEELKRQAVMQALAATGGKKMEAARLLDVDYSSFKRMLERYGL